MTATFTWLDYSEADRRRALTVADLLMESSIVDELGLAAFETHLQTCCSPTQARFRLKRHISSSSHGGTARWSGSDAQAELWSRWAG
jgi:hypothetical protein